MQANSENIVDQPVKKQRKPRAKKERTPEQIEQDKIKMAALREICAQKRAEKKQLLQLQPVADAIPESKQKKQIKSKSVKQTSNLSE